MTERTRLEYDEIAEGYERIWAPRFAEASQALVEFAELRPGDRVLDVATGTGVTAEAALRSVDPGTVVGVDISEGMLRTGATIRDGLRARAEVVDLPFADATFDAVLCSFGIHLFTNHLTALADMLRVARTGGTVAIATWGSGIDEYQRTWRELVSFTVGDQMLKDSLKRRAPGGDRFGTEQGIMEGLREAGLRKLRVEPREFRFVYGLDEYVDALTISATGRFVGQMLGPEAFGSFMRRVRAAFHDRFPDPLQDFNQVLLAKGTVE